MPRNYAIRAEDQFLFRDRVEAGRQLAERLAVLNLYRPLVLALPRGGVPIAIEIAKALAAPLDLLLVRKIGLPWQPELAVGAVVDGTEPHTVINKQIARIAHMDEADIARVAKTQLEEIEHRRRMWLGHRTHVPIAGRTAIVVDDGIATGASVRVALDAVKAQKAARTLLAAPVVPDRVAEALRDTCDGTIFLSTPRDLIAVGMYYRDFHQLRDDEVKRLLNRAWETLPAR
jgi:predicted phosphoribosyltransferase